MRGSRTLHVISAHAEGEVGDVIVGGVALGVSEYLMGLAASESGSFSPWFALFAVDHAVSGDLCL